MRRVEMDLPEQDIGKLGQYTAELSNEVKSLRVMHHLRHDANGSAVICKVRPKETGIKTDGLKFKFKRFEVLSKESDGLIVYLEAEAAPLAPDGASHPRVYLNFPFEIREGSRRITVIGEAAELKKLFRWLERRQVRFQILSNSDARSPPDSALNTLTTQQRKAILAAYASGYYQLPRKINLDMLARSQKVNKSTFAEHLLKAENHLISWIMANEAKTPPNHALPLSIG